MGGYKDDRALFGPGAITFPDAYDNTVYVRSTGTDTLDFVADGASDDRSTAYGKANGNAVIMSGGKVRQIWGGIGGGNQGDNNAVKVTGGTVYDGITGGSANWTGYSTASNNTVELLGGTFGDQLVIIGGEIASALGSAADNLVVIGARPAFENSHMRQLVGGKITGGAVSSGNTLEMHQGGLTTDRLDGFQNYRFYLPSYFQNNDTMLFVDSGNLAGTAVSIDAATVNVGISGRASPLEQGGKIILIDSAGQGLTGTLGNTVTKGEGMQGLSMLYEFALEVEDGLVPRQRLVAIVTRVGENPRLKALLEGQLASAAMLMEGSDLIAWQGLHSALTAVRAHKDKSGPAAFGAMRDGRLRYDSGSHIDMDGYSMLAGLGWNVALGSGTAGDESTVSATAAQNYGNMLLGLFFEAGRGDYDTHNSFGGYASVKGDGDAAYQGGGVLLRYDAACGGYAEASLRTGWMKNDFSTSDLRDSYGRGADYETGSAYYGTHLDIGYNWELDGQTTLDLYSKYLWTRYEGDSATISDERYHFDDIDSHRWRAGARFSYDVALENGTVLTPYAGSYYEYEFDAKARGNVYGRSIESPDLRGSTGMGEFGFGFKPSAGSNLSLDLGAQGYVGKREGLTGSFGLSYAF